MSQCIVWSYWDMQIFSSKWNLTEKNIKLTHINGMLDLACRNVCMHTSHIETILYRTPIKNTHIIQLISNFIDVKQQKKIPSKDPSNPDVDKWLRSTMVYYTACKLFFLRLLFVVFFSTVSPNLLTQKKNPLFPFLLMNIPVAKHIPLYRRTFLHHN